MAANRHRPFPPLPLPVGSGGRLRAGVCMSAVGGVQEWGGGPAARSLRWVMAPPKCAGHATRHQSEQGGGRREVGGHGAIQVRRTRHAPP